MKPLLLHPICRELATQSPWANGHNLPERRNIQKCVPSDSNNADCCQWVPENWHPHMQRLQSVLPRHHETQFSVELGWMWHKFPDVAVWHRMLAPAVANTDVATNVEVNGTEPQQHTAVPTTTVSPIPKVAGHTARKSHRRGKTCIITLSPNKRELEQKKNTSNKSAHDEPRPGTSGQVGSRLKSIKPIAHSSTT